MKKIWPFIVRWSRGETRWNAPVCLAVAVSCSATALLVATVAPRWDIVVLNLGLAIWNLLMSFFFRQRYQDWLASQPTQQ